MLSTADITVRLTGRGNDIDTAFLYSALNTALGHRPGQFCSILKARLHRRFFSRQLDAIFVALKLQFRNRTCKPSAIFNAICRRDIAEVSNMFET